MQQHKPAEHNQGGRSSLLSPLQPYRRNEQQLYDSQSIYSVANIQRSASAPAAKPRCFEVQSFATAAWSLISKTAPSTTPQLREDQLQRFHDCKSLFTESCGEAAHSIVVVQGAWECCWSGDIAKRGRWRDCICRAIYSICMEKWGEATGKWLVSCFCLSDVGVLIYLACCNDRLSFNIDRLTARLSV